MIDTETETAAFHEDAEAMADYHGARIADEQRTAERERLITIAAEGVYGARMDEDNPVGWEVVAAIGRGIAEPFVTALLNHPDVVIAVETAV